MIGILFDINTTLRRRPFTFVIVTRYESILKKPLNVGTVVLDRTILVQFTGFDVIKDQEGGTGAVTDVTKFRTSSMLHAVRSRKSTSSCRMAETRLCRSNRMPSIRKVTTGLLNFRLFGRIRQNN